MFWEIPRQHVLASSHPRKGLYIKWGGDVRVRVTTRGSWGILVIVTFVIRHVSLARLAADIRLITILGHISTEFERKSNADSTVHHVKCVMVREKSANLVKNRCMHNRWGVFLKTNIVLVGCTGQCY